MDKITFRPLKEGDSSQIRTLFDQLAKDVNPDVDYKELINDSKCHCIVLESGNNIIGFGALIRYTVPSRGEVGRIEDVIINQAYRGKGFGRAIMQELISIAKEENISEIDLSSSRIRCSARNLYESLDFKMRESDIFRLEL